jgi:hypothetical protein
MGLKSDVEGIASPTNSETPEDNRRANQSTQLAHRQFFIL